MRINFEFPALHGSRATVRRVGKRAHARMRLSYARYGESAIIVFALFC